MLSVPEPGGTPAVFAVDAAAGESQGAVWMGGAAPVVDGGGNIWVSVGNGSVTSAAHAYDDSDSVLELSPPSTLLQYFAPSSWAADNANDLDMSTAPALLADGQVVAAGKSRIVYLLDGATWAASAARRRRCATPAATTSTAGAAVVGDRRYLPCLSGTDRRGGVGVARRRCTSSGASSVGGGPPDRGRRARLDDRAGRRPLRARPGHRRGARAQATIGVPANHFPTPSVGAGLLLAPSADRVVAFTAPSSPAPQTTTTAVTTTAAATTTTHHARPRPPPQPGTAGPGCGQPGRSSPAVVGGAAVVRHA